MTGSICLHCGRKMPYRGICLGCTVKTVGKPAGKDEDGKDVPRFRIAIDIDDVFLDSIKGWKSAYHRLTGKDAGEIREWNFGDRLGLSERDVVEIFELIQIEDIDLIETSAPLIIEYMKTFADVFFLTAKTDKMMKWTEPFVRRYTDIPIVRCAIGDGNEPMKQLEKFDMIVDDNVKTIFDCCSNSNRFGVIFLRPHNLHVVHHILNTCAGSWDDILYHAVSNFSSWIIHRWRRSEK